MRERLSTQEDTLQQVGKGCIDMDTWRNVDPSLWEKTALTAKALRNLEWPELLENEQCSAMARRKKELSLPLFWKNPEEGLGGYAMGLDGISF